jgi:hypothetical protein
MSIRHLRGLFVHLRDLFSLQVDLVFYDLTSTYFEGHGPPKKLKAAGLDLSATEALTALKCVRVVDFSLGNGATKRSDPTNPARRRGASRRGRDQP